MRKTNSKLGIIAGLTAAAALAVSSAGCSIKFKNISYPEYKIMGKPTPKTKTTQEPKNPYDTENPDYNPNKF